MLTVDIRLILACLFHPVSAEKITNNVAVFAALDKVSARISHFKGAAEHNGVEFGALQITARACYHKATNRAASHHRLCRD